MTIWIAYSARYLGASSGVNCSRKMLMSLVCTSGQMLGTWRDGSIPGKGENLFVPSTALSCLWYRSLSLHCYLFLWPEYGP